MSGILFFLIGLSGLVFLALAVGIWWAVKSGQFDDLEGPAQRILMDDDDPLLPGRGRGSREEEQLKDGP
jgi:cbb3-type cytochrome oxidase maturation protein